MKFIINPGHYNNILDNTWDNKKTVGLPIYSWCEKPDRVAMEQLIDLSNIKYAFHHIATMADCHGGYGMPIGGVIATKHVILPYAVGNDIGCGMNAVRLTYKSDLTPDQINKIMTEAQRVIPHGVGSGHTQKQKWWMFECVPNFPDYIKAALETAQFQLGSLGAGNHFIELLVGSDKHIWLMIHSGSRNLGSQICTEFYHRAKRYCEEMKFNPPSSHLSYLHLNTDDGQWYYSLMEFAVKYARENRQRMMSIFESIACGMLGCDVDREYDIPHNYASFEEHFGEMVLVHRKGATPAFVGQIGIVPGSMGTNSFIVRGKGNVDSFMTVSHGAGRAMSRSEAKKKFKETDTKELLKGIWFNKIALDEDPRCYKDINDVISAQSDLVDPLTTLSPLGVIIG